MSRCIPYLDSNRRAMTPGSSRTGKPCQRLAITLLKVAVTCNEVFFAGAEMFIEHGRRHFPKHSGAQAAILGEI
jgi:hypothetical protein